LSSLADKSAKSQTYQNINVEEGKFNHSRIKFTLPAKSYSLAAWLQNMNIGYLQPYQLAKLSQSLRVDYFADHVARTNRKIHETNFELLSDMPSALIFNLK
jgi:hypothetical protein